MHNKRDGKSSGNDKGITTEDYVRAIVNARESTASLREFTASVERQQASREIIKQFLEDLSQHKENNELAQSQVSKLMNDAEIEFPRCTFSDFETMVYFMDKHALSRGLDKKSVEIIGAAANKLRGLGVRKKAESSWIPKELKIHLYVFTHDLVRRLVIIGLYLAIFFVLYTLIF